LTKDEDPGGGFLNLSRSESAGQYQISLATPLSNPTIYQVESLAGGSWRRTDTLPDGTRSVRTISNYGTESVTSPDGTTASLVEQPDPRWGMQAPLVNSLVTTTPGGLSATLAGTSTASLSLLSDPLSLTTRTSTLAINGRTYSSVYTASSRTFTNTTPMGRESTSTIDLLGRAVRSQLATLEPASFGYDNRGRLQIVSLGNGSAARTTSFAYNGNGWLETITDPMSRVTRFEYDQSGRVTLQTLPDGREIRYSYDANGNITSITPPGRPQHGFDYTEVDLLNVYDPPPATNIGTRVTTTNYDTERKPTRVTRPDGQTIDFDYDTAGRLSALNLPERRLTYGYSPTTGNLASITDSTGGSLSYTYDGTLPKSTSWSGPVTGAVSRNYDNNFRVISRSINGGNTINFTYDNDSLLTSAGSMTLARNPQNGLLAGTTLGNISDSWSYNSFGEPVGYTASSGGMSIYSVGFTRDTLGRITTKTETLGGTIDTYNYGYDATGRLETVSRNGSLISTYTYDANSNRLSARRTTNPEPLTAYTYDNQDRLIASASGTNSCSFAYTANGELQTKTCGTQTTTYTYDVLGNLRRMILPDGTQIDYVIDGQNRRIGKKVNGLMVQGWLYGSQLAPVAELDGNNSIISIYVYGSKANVPDYMVRSGGSYRIISDHLGSPRLVLNSTTGAMAEQIDYDEFGNVTNDTNPGFQPFGFAGGLYDSQTKLVRFGARDYDPETGRWTSKDPISFAGGDANLYEYTFDDPINLLDPSGHLTIPGFGWADVGEGAGQDALGFYIGIINDPTADSLERNAAWVGGFFAALWTPCTSDATFTTLTSAWGVGKWAGRPFWRYVGPRSNPNSGWLTRGWGWKPPYGADFKTAKEVLQLPNMPNAVKQVKVPWWKPVLGPRTVAGNPQWGMGGGWEYFLGWRWPL
ncbi:MAG TPA: RHS repeat-associated core domain-containing protein, partial [Terriglobia bacterium]|nr:RHS repeat-associated core domain-containing protein [Terriglobia bacterium]